MNPNFEQELRQQVERNLGPLMDEKIRHLAARLKGQDRSVIRRELEREGFKNIKDEFVDAMFEGQPIPARITWQ